MGEETGMGREDTLGYCWCCGSYIIGLASGIHRMESRLFKNGALDAISNMLSLEHDCKTVDAA